MHPLAFPSLSSSDLDHLAHGYPRPQLRRSHWVSLNGQWDFSLDPAGTLALPEVMWDRGITVPFSPETIRSTVHDTSFYKACWYRRHVPVPQLENGERLLLHFGAVDYAATVWLDRALAGNHVGGYTPFTIDVTAFLDGRSTCEIVVRAEDDPGDLAKPRGKQDWQREPHSIWYPRTTGIWQTVWLERVPSTWIDSVRWTSSLERWDIGLEAQVAGRWREGLRLGVKLHLGDKLISDDTYGLTSPEIARRIALSDPGIDDSRNELLWSTTSPTLISVTLQLWADRGELVDEATSYTAIRSVTTQGDRFLLNGRPFQLRLVLDQGYWEGSGITPPDDQALHRDVELTRAMGFNGVRKHQKVEDPRYLYWADRAGLLVWEEMPSAYRFTWRSVERLTQEWLQVIERDASHPCIVAWVPFNESWGAPNLPDNPAERHYIRSVYHLTKTLDPTRPVIGNDGWESVATDIIGIHDYDSDPARIGRRYHADEVRPQLFRRERPGGRLLVLEGQPHADHPIVLSEFGGIAFASGPGTWGYCRCGSADELAERYATLLETVRSLDLLAGFCYTQFADTYQEANGLLYADRRPKFSLAQIREATSGGSRPAEPPLIGPPDSGV